MHRRSSFSVGVITVVVSDMKPSMMCIHAGVIRVPRAHYQSDKGRQIDIHVRCGSGVVNTLFAARSPA